MFDSTKWLFPAICVIGLALSSMGCAPMTTTLDGAQRNIVDMANGPGMEDISTFATAIQAADLVDTLGKPGAYTVFAPTNEAFAKLPPGTLDDLLKPENRDKLRSILLYHIHPGSRLLSGAMMARDFKSTSLSTMNGKPITVTVGSGGIQINDAHIVKADIACSNGIVHWIDTVLMP